VLLVQTGFYIYIYVVVAIKSLMNMKQLKSVSCTKWCTFYSACTMYNRGFSFSLNNIAFKVVLDFRLFVFTHLFPDCINYTQ